MKKIFIIGLVLLIVGAAVFGAGWYLTGGNYSVLNGSVGSLEVELGDRSGFVGVRGGKRAGSAEPQEQLYVFDGIQRVVLDESNTSVRVTKSPDGQVHLRCQESDDFYFDIQNQTGVLTLTRRSKPSLNFGWSVSMETELQVPDGLELNLETSNSRITAEGLNARSLRCVTSNGSVQCSDCASGGDLTVKTSNAGVTLTDCAAAQDLTVKTDNGSVTLTRCDAGNETEARTSNSAIAVEGLTAGQRIRLETSNASVRGTLPGRIADYTVESHTSNGSNSLPESYGRGAVELSVKTSNGSIRLEFAED